MLKRTYQNEPRLKEYRRSLRLNAVTAEKVLWNFLRRNQLGYKFRRQFSIGNYIADFYCHTFKLVIELDGWTHEFERTKNNDLKKEEYLIKLGYKVLRLKNEEVFGDVDKLLNKIKLSMVCEPHPLSLPL